MRVRRFPLLRIGEAHHQVEEEDAGEPRRGPEAADRAAPSRVMVWRGEAHHQGDEEVARKLRASRGVDPQ